MDPTILIAIAVAAIVAIVFFVLKGKKEEALPRGDEPKAISDAKPKAVAEEPKSAPSRGAPEAGAKDAEREPAQEAGGAAAAHEGEGAGEAGPPEGEEERTKEPAAKAEEPKEPLPEREGPSAEDVEAIKGSLETTRGGFIARLASLFGAKKEIDPSLLEEIEEILITADIGVQTTDAILTSLRQRLDNDELGSEERIWEALREEARAIMGENAPSLDLRRAPSVVLVVGVNGVGKTTTIGKLASRLVADGKKVMMVAGDTFRAAAVLQLEVWGRRVGCEVLKGKDRADPSSVVFDAIEKGKDEGVDVILVDTAGRLHTKTPLMDELEKVGRTVEKVLERPADEILLVLDATTGQNAIQQAELFKETLPVSGIVLTKLDGTAKGGVVLGIVHQHQMPVQYVGIGERVEDLKQFDVNAFVDALFERPEEAQSAE